jgi:hypothetical protein
MIFDFRFTIGGWPLEVSGFVRKGFGVVRMDRICEPRLHATAEKSKGNSMNLARTLRATGFYVALVLIFSAQLSTCLGQGALTPPAAPGPVMKSLDQIEARTAITNASSPVTISQPGSYYLTQNLTVSNGNGIKITTNGVTLDLNGFTISSTEISVTTNSGILLKLSNVSESALSDITIRNGHIRGGVTNDGSGVYSGGGFVFGINWSGGSQPENVLVSGVSVSGLGGGIYLNRGDSVVVESCTVRTVGGIGIGASTIKNCLAIDCGGNAITGDQVSDCRGQSS